MNCTADAPSIPNLNGWSFDNDYFYDDGEQVIRATDEWLRLNEAGDFTNGVYTRYLLRADDGFQVDGKQVVRSDGTRFYPDNNVVSNSSQGVFWHGDSTAYAIYREPGAWAYPYPDLRIAFHTGIQLGANASYNGIRFYSDYDMSSLVMSVNDASTGGAGNVYMSGNVGIGATSPDAKLNVQGGSDVALSGGGFIITGDLSSTNIGIDNNEIMARDNGAVSNLYIQHEGGSASFGGNLTVGGGSLYLPSSGTLRSPGRMHIQANEHLFLNPWAGASMVYIGGGGGPGNLRALGSITADGNLNVGGMIKLQDQGGIYGDTCNEASEYGRIGFQSLAGNKFLGCTKYGWVLLNNPIDSSIRWKKNITEIDNALDKVLNIRGVYFDWDEEHGGQHDMGMIAEEVGEYIPEIVIYEDDGVYATGMDYGALTPVLVEAIKEQQAQIEELKKVICELKPKAEICN